MCLSASTAVSTADGGWRFASDLQPDTKLLTFDDRTFEPSSSPIEFWLHRQDSSIDSPSFEDWLFVDVAGYTTLTISPLHLVFVKRGRQNVIEAIPAASIRPHLDSVFFSPTREWVKVTQVRHAQPRTESFLPGLFAPFTHQGTLVADGILISTFSQLPLADRASGYLSDLRSLQKQALKHARWVSWLRQQSVGGVTMQDLATAYLAIITPFWQQVLFVDRSLAVLVSTFIPIEIRMKGIADDLRSFVATLKVQPVPDLTHEPIMELARVAWHQILWLTSRAIMLSDSAIQVAIHFLPQAYAYASLRVDPYCQAISLNIRPYVESIMAMKFWG